jgi:thiamine pyrophosphate-dependent acetolactate synthase large subunit-like protein
VDLQQGQLRAHRRRYGRPRIRVEKPGDLGTVIGQALKADCPVIIDVVTDIDALAPLAVS